MTKDIIITIFLIANLSVSAINTYTTYHQNQMIQHIDSSTTDVIVSNDEISKQISNMSKDIENFKPQCPVKEDCIFLKQEIEEYKAWKSIVDQVDSERVFCEVPNLDTSFKSYMDYKYITNKDSVQYRMQQSAYTNEYGIREYDGMYMVAMGTFYADGCGEKFEVTLESGEVFTVITGDIKANNSTDETNMYAPIYTNGVLTGANIIEFIVETDAMPRSARRAGSLGAIDKFSGQIISIERI